jgi:hypothetical protein
MVCYSQAGKGHRDEMSFAQVGVPDGRPGTGMAVQVMVDFSVHMGGTNLLEINMNLFISVTRDKPI